MAETTAVLDTIVFDFGFHIVDTLPVVFKVSVPREFRTIQAGQTVAVTVHIIDNMSSYGRKYPFNPAAPPVMQLYDPADLPFGVPVSMAQIDTGIYTYIQQTTVLDMTGLYSAVFTAINGASSMITRKHGVYTVVEPTEV